MKDVLPLDSPIVPARSLGGFELGRNIGDYHDVLRTAYNSMCNEEPAARLWGFQASFRLPQLLETTAKESVAMFDAFDAFREARAEGKNVELPSPPARPPVGDPAIEIVVDLRDGVIVSLEALRGYEGALVDDVRVGMTYAQVRDLIPIEWSEAVVGRVVTDVAGIALHFDRDECDWTEEELADRELQSIAVFLPERTTSGRVGL